MNTNHLNFPSLSRRSALKTGFAAAAAAAGLISVRAFAASTVNFLGWQGYDDPVTFDDFAKNKGITLNATYIGNNDEIITKLRSGGLGQIDIVTPYMGYIPLLAKLDLIQLWPAKKKEIAETVASGRARARKHGDVDDIGIRKVGEGQEKDVKLGQDAINEMKAYGLLLPEIEDKEIKEYAHKLSDTIAVNSDLKVPVKVFVMESEEINAFTTGGGYVYITRGIMNYLNSEAELAAVLGHEIGHITARHPVKQQTQSTLSNIGAAAVGIFTGSGDLAGLANYAGAALIRGYGRDNELEADRLGPERHLHDLALGSLLYRNKMTLRVSRSTRSGATRELACSWRK